MACLASYVTIYDTTTNSGFDTELGEAASDCLLYTIFNLFSPPTFLRTLIYRQLSTIAKMLQWLNGGFDKLQLDIVGLYDYPFLQRLAVSLVAKLPLKSCHSWGIFSPRQRSSLYPLSLLSPSPPHPRPASPHTYCSTGAPRSLHRKSRGRQIRFHHRQRKPCCSTTPWREPPGLLGPLPTNHQRPQQTRCDSSGPGTSNRSIGSWLRHVHGAPHTFNNPKGRHGSTRHHPPLPGRDPGRLRQPLVTQVEETRCRSTSAALRRRHQVPKWRVPDYQVQGRDRAPALFRTGGV